MAAHIDRAWVNTEIRNFNRSSGRDLEQELVNLTNKIMAHMRWNTANAAEQQMTRKNLARHLELSLDDNGKMQTNALDIIGALGLNEPATPAQAVEHLLSEEDAPRKTLKLSGKMRTIPIRSQDEEDPAPLKLVSELQANGIKASYEHPGYASITTRRGGELAVGTVDGFWGADLSDENGNDIPLQGEFDKFIDKDDATIPLEQVVGAIKQILTRVNA
jgi:hypothetical protein